jgi:hypothetical protein
LSSGRISPVGFARAHDNQRTLPQETEPFGGTDFLVSNLHPPSGAKK